MIKSTETFQLPRERIVVPRTVAHNLLTVIKWNVFSVDTSSLYIPTRPLKLLQPTALPVCPCPSPFSVLFCSCQQNWNCICCRCIAPLSPVHSCTGRDQHLLLAPPLSTVSDMMTLVVQFVSLQPQRYQYTCRFPCRCYNALLSLRLKLVPSS